eukprot:NODE_51_length_27121_cov_0.309452.p1 type:complete len:781 gc:universal NODE_51_length_27121_cov_0.309452:2910-568(-)
MLKLERKIIIFPLFHCFIESMGNELSTTLSKSFNFEGPEMQGGLCWQIRTATKNNQKLTVFYTQKQDNDPLNVLLKKEVGILLKLRHPNILHVQQPPTTVIGFTSEYIKTPLFISKLTEIEKLNGLKQLSTAIQFLHDNAKLIHNCINPFNIYITPSMEWKLAGFYYSNFMQYSTDQIQTQEYNISSNMHIEYSAPEFIINQQITTANDDYSFGMILAFLYNKPPTNCVDNILTYKHFQSNLSSFYSTLPSTISHLVQQTTSSPMVRMSHSDCCLDRLFTDNVALSCLNTFDNINTITVLEKAKFFKALQNPSILQQFPQDMIVDKCFPICIQQLKETQLSAFLIPVVMHIIEVYGDPNHIEQNLLSFQSICTPAYPPNARLQLLKHFKSFDKSRPFFYKNNIIPLLFNCLDLNEDGTNMQVFTLLCDVNLIKLIDYTVLKRLILKRASIYLNSNSRDIFINLIQLLVVNHIIDELLIQEMINLICAINDSPVSICRLFFDLVNHINPEWFINIILSNMIKQIYYCSNQTDMNTCFDYFNICNSKIKDLKIKHLPHLAPGKTSATANIVNISATNIPGSDQNRDAKTPFSNSVIAIKSTSLNNSSKLNGNQVSISTVSSSTATPNADLYNLSSASFSKEAKEAEFGAFKPSTQPLNPFQEEQSFSSVKIPAILPVPSSGSRNDSASVTRGVNSSRSKDEFTSNAFQNVVSINGSTNNNNSALLSRNQTQRNNFSSTDIDNIPKIDYGEFQNPFQEEQSFGAFQTKDKNKTPDYSAFDPFK